MMRKISFQNYSQIASAGVIIFFAVLLFIASFFIESSTVTTLGPEFMPRAVSIALLILGTANLVRGIIRFRFLKEHDQLIMEEKREKSLKEIGLDNLDWISGALILAYVIGIYYLGFLVPSIIYMFLQILLYTTAKPRKNWLLYIIVSIVFPLAVYMLFRNSFHLMLPKGILG